MRPEGEPLLSGYLDDTPLGDLLRNLGQEKESGLLVLKRGDRQIKLFIWEGKVVFALSNDHDDRLGEILLRDGVISAENYFHASSLIGPGRRLGAILVDEQVIDGDGLVEGVKSQVLGIVLKAFTWVKGSYDLYLVENPPQESITLAKTLEQIIFLGTRNVTRWSRILRGCGGSLDVSYRKAPFADQVLSKLDLTEEEGHIVTLAMRGKMTAGEVCDTSFSPSYETLRTLWALVSCGVLQVVRPEEREAEEDAGVDRTWALVLEKANRALRAIYALWVEKSDNNTANGLTERGFSQVRHTHPVLNGMDIRGTGELDEESLSYNLINIPEADYAAVVGAALEELVGSMQLVHMEEFGPGSMAEFNACLQEANGG